MKKTVPLVDYSTGKRVEIGTAEVEFEPENPVTSSMHISAKLTDLEWVKRFSKGGSYSLGFDRDAISGKLTPSESAFVSNAELLNGQ